ncbi:hypothetical protein SK128_000703, partial [Halocaridina rubra]
MLHSWHCCEHSDLNDFDISIRSRLGDDEFIRLHQQVEDIHLRPTTDIRFGAKFCLDLSK